MRRLYKALLVMNHISITVASVRTFTITTSDSQDVSYTLCLRRRRCFL